MVECRTAVLPKTAFPKSPVRLRFGPYFFWFFSLFLKSEQSGSIPVFWLYRFHHFACYGVVIVPGSIFGQALLVLLVLSLCFIIWVEWAWGEVGKAKVMAHADADMLTD